MTTTTSPEWAVTLDLDGPRLTNQRLDDLVDELGNAVTYDGSRLSTTITVPAFHVSEALNIALERVVKAVRNVTTDVVDVSRATVMTVDEQDAELAHPLYPELVGVTEAAEIFGVTRQRASQLLERLEPVTRLAGGPVWRGDAVRSFAAIARRPGRPPKTASRVTAAKKTSPTTRKAGVKKTAAKKKGVRKVTRRRVVETSGT